MFNMLDEHDEKWKIQCGKFFYDLETHLNLMNSERIQTSALGWMAKVI